MKLVKQNKTNTETSASAFVEDLKNKKITIEMTEFELAVINRVGYVIGGNSDFRAVFSSCGVTNVHGSVEELCREVFGSHYKTVDILDRVYDIEGRLEANRR